MIKKRVLAALMSLIMLLSVLTSAMADAVYTYPQLGVTIKPSEMAEMEREFRVWAKSVIYEYYAGRYGTIDTQTNSKQPYGEYYRLAATKTAFDKTNVLDEDIIYNTLRDSDWTQNEGVYTWVLIESLKEAVRFNEEQIKQSYNSIPEESREYVLVDISDGKFHTEDILIGTNELAERRLEGAWLECGTDIGFMALDAILEYKTAQASKKSDGFNELINGMIDSGDAIIESLVDSAMANARAYATNMARETLISELATQLYGLDMATVAFLRNSYSNDHTIVMYGHDALVKKFIDQIDPKTNPKIHALLAEEAEDISASYSAAIDFVDATGMELMSLLDVPTMLCLGAIEAYGETITNVLSALNTEIDAATKGRYIQVKGKTIVRIKWSTLSGIVLDTLSETTNHAIDTAIEALYAEFDQGKAFNWKDAVNRVNDELVEAFSNGDMWDIMAANLLEAVPELAESLFQGAFVKGSGFELICSIFTGALDSEKMYTVLTEGKLSFEDVTELISNIIISYNSAYWADLGGPVEEKSLEELLGVKKEVTEELGKAQTREKRNKLRDKLDVARENCKWATVSMVLNICDRIWESGNSLGEALQSTVASASQEGTLSLLASGVSSSRNLSNGVLSHNTYTIRDMMSKYGVDAENEESFDFILDSEKISVEEIVDLISSIHVQVKYDIVGTNFYYNIAYRGFVNQDFNGSEFWNHIKKNHVNVYDQKGLLNEKMSRYRYNWAVGFYQDYYVSRWDPNWQIFLD